MRKLTLIGIMAAIFAACSSNQNNPIPNNSIPTGQSPANLHWIPNWNDTVLLGMLMPSQDYDTLLAYTRNDTSLIKYKGVEYYIWIDSKYTPFNANATAYPLCYIGQYSMDTSNYLTTCSSTVGKFYDENYNIWKSQVQSVILTLKPPFPSTILGSTYQSFYF